jgi:glycosyltransferase involved in cell wall biosynthesis
MEEAPVRRILYVSPNSIGTPLVRSQVLPYLRALMARRVDVRLVTFERGEPYPYGEFPRARWIGMRARSGSSLPAKILDAVVGVLLVASVALRQRSDVLHARSYLPAAITWLVGAVLRRPYVFDMRGFLGEEYIDAGHWTAQDLRYRALKLAERVLLRDAGTIVVLTHGAAQRLRSEPEYAHSVGATPIAVVPCAVDLDRFHPPAARDEAPTLVYSGSLGMWYLLDAMLRVYGLAREVAPDLRFLILNRNEHDLVRSAIARAGLADAAIELRAADFVDMPGQLGRAHVAIALLKQVPSKIGSSPIKVAEYLACGLPVVVNAGLGDTDALIASHAAGHIVRTYDGASLRDAALAVVRLAGDAASRARARSLAETEFSVASGAATYEAIYARLG